MRILLKNTTMPSVIFQAIRKAFALPALAVLVFSMGCSSSPATPAVCGDGVASPGEDCDGSDLRGQTCADFGFNSGTLACHERCVVDLRGCANLEMCDNGLDDDADGDTDCADADCADAVACEVCGDGRLTGDEQCDDGNTSPGDCCDAACHAEPGCEVEPDDDPAAADLL